MACKKTACLWGASLGLGACVLFSLLRNAFLGLSFLMMLCAALGAFIALLFLLFYPWKGKGARLFCQTIRRFLLVCAICGVLSFAALEGAVFAHAGGDPPMETPAVIVLGAGLYGETPSASLASRLHTAHAYLDAYPDTLALLSGGQGPGESIPEALAMARWLSQKGIEPDRLLLEDRSTSTRENLVNCLPLLKDRFGATLPEITLVTNDFHLYRAKLLAVDLGLSVRLLSAETPQIGLVPLSLYLREYFSLLKYYLLD